MDMQFGINTAKSMKVYHEELGLYHIYFDDAGMTLVRIAPYIFKNDVLRPMFIPRDEFNRDTVHALIETMYDDRRHIGAYIKEIVDTVYPFCINDELLFEDTINEPQRPRGTRQTTREPRR